MDEKALVSFLSAVTESSSSNARPKIAEWVDTLEKSSEFKNLELSRNEVRSFQTFMRRSGLYIDAHAMTPVNVQEKAIEILALFNTPVGTTTRKLAALSAVAFDAPILEYERFSIRRFDCGELDAALQNPVSRAFFPAAVVDSTAIENYWFLDVQAKRPGGRASLLPDPKVKRRFTPHDDLNFALSSLVLWDWEAGEGKLEQKQDPKRAWKKFEIPFVLTVPNDLRVPPNTCPRLVELDFEINEDTGNTYFFYDHRVPVSDFDPFIERWSKLLGKIESRDNFRFLKLAISWMTKSLFAIDEEELLWHLVAIEAMLGEDPERGGLTGLLKKRIKALHGQDAGKRFEKLYGLRSNHVHGNVEYMSEDLYVGHLRDARILARATAMWFLRMVEHLDLEKVEEAQLPTREQILKAIDMDQRTRESLCRLLSLLPTEFPQWS